MDGEENILLFRPDKNMERLTGSMERLCMPGADFDNEELLKCIEELIRVDQRWIPWGEGYSLYIRPTVIATDRFLGVAAPKELLLYVITCPVGPYYKSGYNPIRLTCDTPYVRAWQGGTGKNLLLVWKTYCITRNQNLINACGCLEYLSNRQS